MAQSDSPLIFERSRPGRASRNLLPVCDVPQQPLEALLGAESLRERLPLPEVSELDVVRHFTQIGRAHV